MTAAERKKLKHRQAVEGRAARVRLDRAPKKRADGGAAGANEDSGLRQYEGKLARYHEGDNEPSQPERARGGSVKQQFNSAIHDNPARPTVDEPGPLPAVAARARGGRMRKGWVDGQPAKGEGN